MLDVCLSHVFA
ncbi:TPA: hypothetical protein RUZ88_003685 [Vibrio cholerae]|nr:hypothetical protein [Vibrio cholerae]